ncbi:acyltransferase [Novosphingobium sp. TH158]|uniref:acyltransferase family protein n=1 Tax=Novosphingobium sp. TH158 TaxID=2067455 RepID=UPI0013044F86|nr:acyltransferase [Novosphingobium sp. TH158]
MQATSFRPAGAGAERLHGLDALRGIAAMAVVVMHASVLFPGFPDLFPRGYLAVDFFFMLSGYVMARTYEARLANGMPARRFFIARYKRLWPTMALGGVLFIPFLAEGTRGEDLVLWKVALVNLVLLPNPWAGNYFALNVPGWSIFFELVANAAHALLWKARTWLLGLLAGVSMVGLAKAAHAFGHLDLGSRNGELWAGLARVATAYTMGVLTWRLWGERRLDPLTALPALVAMPLWFAVADKIDGTNWLWDIAFVAFVALPVLLGGLAMTGAQAISRWAGELSFPIYAIHYPLLYWFRAAGLPAPAAIAGCVVAAWLLVLVQQNWRTALGRPAKGAT